jgi:chromosome segregation ATPase
VARDEAADRAAIFRAAESCLAGEQSRTVAALAKVSGVPRATLYRLYTDLVDDFTRRCNEADIDQPGTVARLRSDLAELRERDRQRLARISELEAQNDALRNAARLLRAENSELRVAHNEGRAARIIPLDRAATRTDLGAFSWEQLSNEHLALIAEHAETKADLERARRTISRLRAQRPQKQSHKNTK